VDAANQSCCPAPFAVLVISQIKSHNSSPITASFYEKSNQEGAIQYTRADEKEKRHPAPIAGSRLRLIPICKGLIGRLACAASGRPSYFDSMGATDVSSRIHAAVASVPAGNAYSRRMESSPDCLCPPSKDMTAESLCARMRSVWPWAWILSVIQERG